MFKVLLLAALRRPEPVVTCRQQSRMVESPPLEVQTWPIDRFVLYGRNPRKNDAVVDRMCSSIREYGFKIPGISVATLMRWQKEPEFQKALREARRAAFG